MFFSRNLKKTGASIFSDSQIAKAMDRSQAIIHFSPDGHILYANSNFLNALGYSLSDITGQHHRIFCDPIYASSEQYDEFWDDLRAGNFQSGTYRRITQSGDEIHIQATYNPIKDDANNVIGVVKYAVDISIPTLKAQEAIARTQATISFTTDGHVTAANSTFLDAFGYRLDEILGKHHRMFCGQDYINSKAYIKLWRDLQAGKSVAGEFKRVSKSGQDIFIRASYNPEYDLNGNVTGVTKMASNITDDMRTLQ